MKKPANPRNQFYTPNGVIPPGHARPSIIPERPVLTSYVDDRGRVKHLPLRERIQYKLECWRCSALSAWHGIHPADRELIGLIGLSLLMLGLMWFFFFGLKPEVYQPEP